MLSTDRKILDPATQVAERTRGYASFCEELCIIVAGTGTYLDSTSGNVHLLFPGGKTKFENFVNMALMARASARAMSATIVTAQDPFFTGLVGVCAAYAVRAPLQIQIHTEYFAPAFIFESVRHVAEFLLSFVVIQFATCIRAVSEHIARHVRRSTRTNVSVLSIRPSIERFGRDYERPKEFGTQPVILTVSRLASEKRIHLVIGALKYLKDAHLYVVGDGQEKGALATRAMRLGLAERVHFLGWKSDVAAYYRHANCFVQMSSYEGYGISLVEAIASGTPAVSTAVGIATELPPGSVTIVPPREYELSKALIEILDSPAIRSKSREAGAQFVQSIPSETEYLECYKQLLHTCRTHA